MNSKNLKFLQLFEDFFKTDFFADKKMLAKSVKAFLDLDYQLAVELWDYLCTTREDEMTDDRKVADILGETVFNMFYDRAPTKCVKALCDTPLIRRAVYQYSTKSATGASFAIITELLSSNKVEASDEILKCLIKNPYISFGESMKRIMETVYIELLKKNPAKIEMSKKLSALLLAYIKRIKTDERAMLEQRLREVQ